MLAPIESAIVAPGIVSVDSNVRAIQHLEGGIIEEILVREGEIVEEGQVLIRLDNTIPVSVQRNAQAEKFALKALEARLIAERDGLDEIAFDPELSRKIGDRAARAAIASQIDLFERRQQLRDESVAVSERMVAALESEIGGLEGRLESAEVQRELIFEETETVAELVRRGLGERSRLSGLRRELAEIEGEISSTRAAIGAAQQRKELVSNEFLESETRRAKDIAEELAQVQARAYAVERDLAAASDVLNRTEILSPTSGVVNRLQVTTVGGVIGPREDLLDIVPIGDKLVVRARIDPLDIDQVSSGMPARVMLNAFNRRNVDALDGMVETVSADTFVDPASGASYYLARIEFDEAEVRKSELHFQSGMSAEVMIRTGERSIFSYILAPIERVLRVANREL